VNVKEACDISADAFDLQADGRVTGSIFEVCNTTRNYSILAVYRPLGESESISVNYNGAPRQLERSGMSVIATRFGQALRSIPVTVDATNISTPISIAFTVTSV
jgi:hypothetical protein